MSAAHAVWPFVYGTPTKEHRMLVRINRAVPKYLPEQVRQDVCQNVALALVRGAPLTRQLVLMLVDHEQKRQEQNQRMVALDAFIGSTDRRLRDVISEHHPRRKYRPVTEPHVGQRRRADYRRTLTPDQIAAIRAMLASGRYSCARVAVAFDVSEEVIAQLSEHLGLVPQAVSAAPQISAEEGSQDSTGTFSSPTSTSRVEAGRNVSIACAETAQRSREKSPGVSNSLGIRNSTGMEQKTADRKDVSQFIVKFCELYKLHRRGAKYLVRRPKDLVLTRQLLDTYGHDDLAEMVTDLLTARDDDWLTKTDRGIGILAVKASWLSGRLADKRETETQAEDWFDECKRVHGGECELNRWRHMTRMQAERKQSA